MHDVEAALAALSTGVPFTLRDAAAVGISRWVLDRLVRRGRVVRVAHGLYAAHAPTVPEEERWRRAQRLHLARAHQVVATHPTHVLSHQTAALAYGWPVGLATLGRVHLTAIELASQSRLLPGAVLHHSGTVVNHIQRRGEDLLTEPARTVADCLRTLSPAQSVAVADGAIRAGDTTLAQVRDVLRDQRRWPGVPRALAAADLVDPRRETWLESSSFVTLHAFGIAIPLAQVQVFDHTGKFLGRVDGLWLACGLVGEADGQGKYLKVDGPTGADPREAARRVVAERARERAIEHTGLGVVRWSTQEIHDDPAEVAQRVIRAQAGGDITRFRGRLRLDSRWIYPTGLD